MFTESRLSIVWAFYIIIKICVHQQQSDSLLIFSWKQGEQSLIWWENHIITKIHNGCII